LVAQHQSVQGNHGCRVDNNREEENSEHDQVKSHLPSVFFAHCPREALSELSEMVSDEQEDSEVAPDHDKVDTVYDCHETERHPNVEMAQDPQYDKDCYGDAQHALDEASPAYEPIRDS
jgi:hypothetical protein